MKIVDYHIKRHDLRRSELNEIANTPQYEQEIKKFEILNKKQSKLLYSNSYIVCISTLQNLAEDIQIEKKMKKKFIISYLVKLLERDSLPLLEVVFSFLKKMSVFAENKDEMLNEEKIVEKLGRFIPCPHHQNLCLLILRLIHNLCFDKTIREQFDSMGYIPRLVSLLKVAAFRGIIIRILYQLSFEDKAKSTFTYTECIPIVYMLIIQFPEQRVGKELMGLGINLAANPRNAEIFADGNQLDNLVKRALECQDELVMKLVRTISWASKTPNVQETLEKYARKFAELVCSNGEMDFSVEVLGTLVNLELEDEWASVLGSTQILDFVQQNLVGGYAEDDVVLECIMLVGSVLTNEKCAKMIGNTLITKLLQNLLADKQEDDEIVLQIMYTFYKMLLYASTRNSLFNQTKVVEYVMELLQDKNPRIRKMADQVLSVVQEFDPQWKEEIKLRRYQLYNAEWLTFIEQAECMENYEDYNSEDEHSSQMSWADVDELDGRLWGEIDD